MNSCEVMSTCIVQCLVSLEGAVKYSLFPAIYNRVVGRPHGDMYHAQIPVQQSSSQLAEDKKF